MEDPNMQRFLETWEDEFNDPSAAVKQILVKI